MPVLLFLGSDRVPKYLEFDYPSKYSPHYTTLLKYSFPKYHKLQFINLFSGYYSNSHRQGLSHNTTYVAHLHGAISTLDILLIWPFKIRNQFNVKNIDSLHKQYIIPLMY